MAKRKLGAIYGLLFAIAAALMCAFALTFDIPAEYASAEEPATLTELDVPGRRHYDFGRPGHSTCSSHQRARNAGGTVLILSGGETYRIYLYGTVAAHSYEPCDLRPAKLCYHLCPAIVAIVGIREVGDLVTRRGAALTFVVWGGLHGLFVAAEGLLPKREESKKAALVYARHTPRCQKVF